LVLLQLQWMGFLQKPLVKSPQAQQLCYFSCISVLLPLIGLSSDRENLFKFFKTHINIFHINPRVHIIDIKVKNYTGHTVITFKVLFVVHHRPENVNTSHKYSSKSLLNEPIFASE
jgi:hypothetical protein